MPSRKQDIFTREELPAEVIACLEVPPEGAMGLDQLVKDLKRSLSFEDEHKVVNSKDIPAEKYVDSQAFSTFLRESGWSDANINYFIQWYSQAPSYAPSRLSCLAMQWRNKQFGGNLLPSFADTGRHVALYHENGVIYYKTTVCVPDGVSQGRGILFSGAGATITSTFMLKPEGFKFIDVAISGEGSESAAIILQYLNYNKLQVYAKNKLQGLCGEYKQHLRKAMQRIWSALDAKSYKAYFLRKDLINSEDFVEWVETKSGRLATYLSSSKRGTTGNNKPLYESFRLALEKYAYICILEKIFNAQEMTIEEELKLFKVTLQGYRESLVRQRDIDRNIGVPVVNIFQSIFFPLLQNILPIQGQRIVDDMESTLEEALSVDRRHRDPVGVFSLSRVM